MRGKWDDAMELLKRHPKAVTARISERGTILHLAVILNKVDIAKELVHLMTPEDLEIRNSMGLTTLHSVIHNIPESVELAKCMVEKNKKLLSIAFPDSKKLPLVEAAVQKLPLVEAAVLGAVKMAQYLYYATPPETLDRYDCATLISFGFKSKSLDIAWDLLQRFPELAIGKDYYGGTPLNQLAGMRYAFLSGSSLEPWERMIYDDIQIKPMPPVDKNKKPVPTTDDVCINVQKPENGDQNNQGQRHLISSGTSLRGLVVNTFYKHLGYTRIYQMKFVHLWILEFLPGMCKVTKNKAINELQGLETAMFLAIKRGHVEYIDHLFRANGDLQYIVNEKGMGIFQFAAKCRQHKVFNLLCGLVDDENLRSHVSRKDKLGNNMLHVVGTISSVAQINHTRNAALKMQRELQWFKEVERISSAIDLEEINHTDKMIPRELFTKGHKELVKEGEKAMKDTAKSCTVVGALIVTIMFVVAFTVPGGNNQDTGLPIFLSKKKFIGFMVFDAISLCFSSISVLIFLEILTSRYAENDFLKSLPTKMILGLITLFLAFATMMIAFSSALSIMFHGKSFIANLLAFLSILPVISFELMQLPYLFEFIFSTKMFQRKKKIVPNWPRVNVIINDAY